MAGGITDTGELYSPYVSTAVCGFAGKSFQNPLPSTLCFHFLLPRGQNLSVSRDDGGQRYLKKLSTCSCWGFFTSQITLYNVKGQYLLKVWF